MRNRRIQRSLATLLVVILVNCGCQHVKHKETPFKNHNWNCVEFSNTENWPAALLFPVCQRKYISPVLLCDVDYSNRVINIWENLQQHHIVSPYDKLIVEYWPTSVYSTFRDAVVYKKYPDKDRVAGVFSSENAVSEIFYCDEYFLSRKSECNNGPQLAQFLFRTGLYEATRHSMDSN